MQKKDTTTKIRNRKRLAAALMELLTNPETPEELEDKLSEFINDASSGSIVGRYTEVPGGLQALEHLLAFAEWEKANPNWSGIVANAKEVSHASN